MQASHSLPTGDILGQQLAEFRKRVVNISDNDNVVGINLSFHRELHSRAF